jgi:SagB-type dehydrogenase family enzyme
MAFAHDYLEAVLHRGRDGMPPYGFRPNWSDAPRQTKLYRGLDVLELPVAHDDDVPVREAFTAEVSGPGNGFTLPALAQMLQNSYFRHARRVEINANEDVDKIQSYRSGKFARGTASGGGLYPVSIYWVAGPSAPVMPGVYYYSSPHHGIQRLLAGDVSGQVAAALGGDQDTDQFLLLGLKFWQNAFKYNSFSYHATTMDIGTLVQTWKLWAGPRGLAVRPAFWFDEPRLSELIGVKAEDEGVLAVVPLRWDDTSGAAASEDRSAVTHKDSERSREVLRFETLAAIHGECAENSTARPEPDALAPAKVQSRDSAALALDKPDYGDRGLTASLRSRRSSFGLFDGRRPLTAGELSTVLAAAARGADFPCDVSTADIVRTYVFVNHVDGIPPGIYAYDDGELHPVKAGAQGEFLQRNYFLSNYNVEQTAAVIVPALRGSAVIDAVGPRGYRLLNALIGSVAQAVYTASAGIGIGCGAALGFDNISYIDELDLAESGEVPLLILMVGNDRGGYAGCRYENN